MRTLHWPDLIAFDYSDEACPVVWIFQFPLGSSMVFFGICMTQLFVS